MHQAIIFVSLLTFACASAKGIVLSLFVCMCVCVCVCPSVFSVPTRALSVKRGHVGCARHSKNLESSRPAKRQKWLPLADKECALIRDHARSCLQSRLLGVLISVINRPGSKAFGQ